MDHFLRGRSIERLDEAERDRLEGLISRHRRLSARTTLVERGEELRQSTLLVEGFMIRYIDDVEGHRQIVSFHVPGDFVDLHGYPLRVLDHSIATITDALIAVVPHSQLSQIMDSDPTLARKLWAATLLDAAMHREWLFRLGRLEAVGRIAHFLAETDARLQAIGLSDGRTCALPITQGDLAEITGLTSIHVNRVLRTLREENICLLRASRLEILDRHRLYRIGQFDPTYLYLKATPPTSAAGAESARQQRE
ncbi:Crp/Fnr family transcriptional regulator [Flavisphingomonas formosensis]|uniref:Crp/Fnr family transcriptional regulator n=1 Tax=Flavisphingomonas formosensis TaxID=861534 RepID=UPI0012F9AFE0|nr:Crp/Fnr family transcriptional regulator [Sphingomonas formosensis]